MKALIISPTYDVAGIGYRLKRAAERHPEVGLRIRSVHRRESYLDYPSDLRWSRKPALVAELFASVDVVHLNNRPNVYRRLARTTRRAPPGLLHHHGTIFRRDPDALMLEARRLRLVQAVSTIDLTLPAPELLHWLPSPVAIDELERIRQEHRREPDGKVLIAHAPTRRSVKSTDALEAAVTELQADGLPVELDVIQGVSNGECLRRKARADVLFDQVHLGYGVNALEAWAMRIPVIAGAAPPILSAMRSTIGGRLPFYQATEETIGDAVRCMAESTLLRAAWADIGRRYVERFHADVPVLERLSVLYVEARRS